MGLELYYKIVEKDGKQYTNLYLKVENTYVAIKTSFLNGFLLLKSIAKPLTD